MINIYHVARVVYVHVVYCTIYFTKGVRTEREKRDNSGRLRNACNTAVQTQLAVVETTHSVLLKCSCIEGGRRSVHHFQCISPTPTMSAAQVLNCIGGSRRSKCIYSPITSPGGNGLVLYSQYNS